MTSAQRGATPSKLVARIAVAGMRTRQELSASSGSQFDPAVVTAFLAVLDRRAARAVQLASPAGV